MLRTLSILTLSIATVAPMGAQPPALEIHTVNETWFTTRQPRENVDSPAAWHGRDGTSLLLVTAKGAHCVNVFDASNGYFLRRVGGLGVELGQFNRPNGAWVSGDVLFVVERDNHRVQALRLPDCSPLGTFGEDDLVKPYGLVVLPKGEGEFVVYVTDNYEDATGEMVPQAEMGRRVRVYEVEIAGPGAEGELVNTFGDTQGAGVLNVVESINYDPAHQRLLIADEDMDTPGGQNIKVYTPEGQFTGKTIGDGIFRYQPEGIALHDTGNGTGMWICTDQGLEANYFHCFDRETLAYLGTIEGTYTLNTDGIWLDPTPTGDFPKGVFYAIDNDASVAAFDMCEILEALGK